MTAIFDYIMDTLEYYLEGTAFWEGFWEGFNSTYKGD